MAVRVSGQRLVNCGAVGPPSRSLPPPFLPREVALRPSVALYREKGVGRGAWLRQGGAPRGTVPPPLFRARRLGRRGVVVTCVAACVRVGAVAVAGSAGGRASG